MYARLERQKSDTPLLGDESFPSFRNAPRRLTRGVLLCIVGGIVGLSALYAHAGPESSVLQEHLVRLKDTYLPGKPQEHLLAPVEWSDEDERLRDFNWETPEAHPSLLKQIDGLSPSSRRVREWLLRTRSVSQQGTGIGLGATNPPHKVEQGPAAPTHSKDPRDGEGPGLFSTGSKNKYNELVKEWKTGRPAGACEKGPWEDEYTKLHAEMLAGEREPFIFENVCPKEGWCGGFADRMLGIVTTFLYSVISGRAFLLNWEQPTPPDLVFDSPFIDWSVPFNLSSTTPRQYPFNNQTLADNYYFIEGHDWPDWQLDTFFPAFEENYGAGKNASWLAMDINRGVTIRSFYYAKVIPRLEELGLRFTSIYSCLMNYLFRPKPAVLKFINYYTSLFSLPETFVVGLQIRTGDGNMFFAGYDTNSAEHHSKYWTCAAQLAKRHAHPSQKILYYLVTDSKKLEESALKAFPDQVIVTGLPQSHDEILYKDKSGVEVAHGAAKGFLHTIAESWIFSATDFQVITYRSGFGKIPTWLRGKDHTTVQLFNEYLDPGLTAAVKAGNGGKLPPVPDCSLPSAIKSMADLAQDWSLG